MEATLAPFLGDERSVPDWGNHVTRPHWGKTKSSDFRSWGGADRLAPAPLSLSSPSPPTPQPTTNPPFKCAPAEHHAPSCRPNGRGSGGGGATNLAASFSPAPFSRLPNGGGLGGGQVRLRRSAEGFPAPPSWPLPRVRAGRSRAGRGGHGCRCRQPR